MQAYVCLLIVYTIANRLGQFSFVEANGREAEIQKFGQNDLPFNRLAYSGLKHPTTN